MKRRGRPPRTGSSSASRGQLDREPADLGLGRGHHRRVGGAREQLRAEADAERRQAEVEQPLQEERLLAQPRMVVVLVRVHRAAEDHHRAVGVERPRDRRPPGEAPLVEPVAALERDLAERAGAAVVAVDHAEHVHRRESSRERGRRRPRSRRFELLDRDRDRPCSTTANGRDGGADARAEAAGCRPEWPRSPRPRGDASGDARSRTERVRALLQLRREDVACRPSWSSRCRPSSSRRRS